jgi:hypothetical protein
MHSTLLPQQQLHGFSCMIKIENWNCVLMWSVGECFNSTESEKAPLHGHFLVKWHHVSVWAEHVISTEAERLLSFDSVGCHVTKLPM